MIMSQTVWANCTSMHNRQNSILFKRKHNICHRVCLYTRLSIMTNFWLQTFNFAMPFLPVTSAGCWQHPAIALSIQMMQSPKTSPLIRTLCSFCHLWGKRHNSSFNPCCLIVFQIENHLTFHSQKTLVSCHLNCLTAWHVVAFRQPWVQNMVDEVFWESCRSTLLLQCQLSFQSRANEPQSFSCDNLQRNVAALN